MSRVLVVVPAFNEERSIGVVVKEVRELGFPVCVVDDGSTDGTARVAQLAGAEVLRLPLNLGVGGALRAGFRWARAHGFEVVVQVDADGQHEPAQIGTLLEAMERANADMVIGSRWADGDGTFAVSRRRRLAMRVLAWRASRATHTRITDSTSGFRAIGGQLLERFSADYPVEYLGDTLEALVEAGNHGATVMEVPVRMSQRRHGTSTAGLLASVWYVVRVVIATELMRNRRRRPPGLAPPESADME